MPFQGRGQLAHEVLGAHTDHHLYLCAFDQVVRHERGGDRVPEGCRKDCQGGLHDVRLWRHR
eukprot:3071932-Prymnesium_polylepis.1